VTLDFPLRVLAPSADEIDGLLPRPSLLVQADVDHESGGPKPLADERVEPIVARLIHAELVAGTLGIQRPPFTERDEPVEPSKPGPLAVLALERQLEMVTGDRLVLGRDLGAQRVERAAEAPHLAPAELEDLVGTQAGGRRHPDGLAVHVASAGYLGEAVRRPAPRDVLVLDEGAQLAVRRHDL